MGGDLMLLTFIKDWLCGFTNMSYIGWTNPIFDGFFGGKMI